MSRPRAEKPGPETPAPVIIEPHGVYSPAEVRSLLRLRESSLRREIREGRLAVSKRWGRYFFLGEQLLDWLRSGTLRPRAARLGNGHPAKLEPKSASRFENRPHPGPRKGGIRFTKTVGRPVARNRPAQKTYVLTQMSLPDKAEGNKPSSEGDQEGDAWEDVTADNPCPICWRSEGC